VNASTLSVGDIIGRVKYETDGTAVWHDISVTSAEGNGFSAKDNSNSLTVNGQSGQNTVTINNSASGLELMAIALYNNLIS